MTMGRNHYYANTIDIGLRTRHTIVVEFQCNYARPMKSAHGVNVNMFQFINMFQFMNQFVNIIP